MCAASQRRFSFVAGNGTVAVISIDKCGSEFRLASTLNDFPQFSLSLVYKASWDQNILRRQAVRLLSGGAVHNGRRDQVIPETTATADHLRFHREAIHLGRDCSPLAWTNPTAAMDAPKMPRSNGTSLRF